MISIEKRMQQYLEIILENRKSLSLMEQRKIRTAMLGDIRNLNQRISGLCILQA